MNSSKKDCFLVIDYKHFGEMSQKRNFSFWAGRMALICGPELALGLLTIGKWVELGVAPTGKYCRKPTKPESPTSKGGHTNP